MQRADIADDTVATPHLRALPRVQPGELSRSKCELRGRVGQRQQRFDVALMSKKSARRFFSPHCSESAAPAIAPASLKVSTGSLALPDAFALNTFPASNRRTR